MRALFVTGASGFVGRRLLAGIPAGRYARVTALSRGAPAPAAGVTWVRGDVRDPASWASHLDADTDVAHLAAATGKADAATHHAVNADGTAALLRACERARVGGLLFVSSIAAKFPDDSHYPYARAKREAEALVRASGLPHLVVRPTIVLGPGSPILDALRRLAGLPAVAAIGGGRARVQPVHVDDLATMLARLLERRAFDGTTVECGGPEVLTMADLLVRVRRGMGKPAAPVVRLPYGPMRAAAIAATMVLGRRAPLTAGQLSSFVHDGVIEPGALWNEMRAGLKPVDEMVRGDSS
jgi:nucleoside-diphosphate-sugar epimerase